MSLDVGDYKTGITFSELDLTSASTSKYWYGIEWFCVFCFVLLVFT